MSKYWADSRCNGKENIWYAIDVTTEERIIIKFFPFSSTDEYKVSREAYTMKYLHNEDPKHFLEMYEFVEDNSENQYAIAMEIADCSLEDIVDERGYFTEEEAIPILKETLYAIKVMHDNNFIHRDLKLSNILLKDRNDLSSIKIIDFGETVDRSDDYSISGIVGTLHYMAPEILKNKDYGKPVDMWAFGVMAYRLLTGFFPYITDGNNRNKQLKTILNNDLSYLCIDNKRLSIKAIDFINNILDPEPRNRISIETAINHPFLNPDIEGNFVPSKPLPKLLKTTSGDYMSDELMENEGERIIVLQEGQNEDVLSDDSSEIYPLMTRVNGRFKEFKETKLQRYSECDRMMVTIFAIAICVTLYYMYIMLSLYIENKRNNT